MKNYKTLLLIFVIWLGLNACSQDKTINKSIRYIDKFSKTFIAKIDDASNLDKGLDDAQAYFQKNQKMLRRHIKQASTIRRVQVEQKTIDSFYDAIQRNLKAVENIKIKYQAQAVKDKVLAEKLNRVVKMYTNLILEK